MTISLVNKVACFLKEILPFVVQIKLFVVRQNGGVCDRGKKKCETEEVMEERLQRDRKSQGGERAERKMQSGQ